MAMTQIAGTAEATGGWDRPLWRLSGVLELVVQPQAQLFAGIVAVTGEEVPEAKGQPDGVPEVRVQPPE